MPCYGPLYGYYSKDLNADGKRSLTFDKRKSFSGIPIMVPCGECIGCRLSWRRQWAIRCLHEKRMHAESAFLTLTYDEKSLPRYGSLSLRDLQLFMKRLRKARPNGLRFFACGEYGDTTQRAHYHILLFNTSFTDMRYYKNSDTGEPLFTSKELTSLWSVDGKSLGGSNIGSVTAGSCAYVAGYVLKKVGRHVDHPNRLPEFRVMSRRPGIGLSWLERFSAEAYRHDSAILNGHEVPLPRYYDSKQDEERMRLVKRKRKAAMLLLNPEDRTQARMMTRELFELRKAKLFAREV